MMYAIKRLQPGEEALATELVNRVKYQSASITVTADYLAQFLQDAGHCVIAALADGVVVGFVLAYRLARVSTATGR
jgi:hypothetical protein